MLKVMTLLVFGFVAHGGCVLCVCVFFLLWPFLHRVFFSNSLVLSYPSNLTFGGHRDTAMFPSTQVVVDPATTILLYSHDYARFIFRPNPTQKPTNQMIET